jgi:hypothetical protein
MQEYTIGFQKGGIEWGISPNHVDVFVKYFEGLFTHI